MFGKKSINDQLNKLNNQKKNKFLSYLTNIISHRIILNKIEWNKNITAHKVTKYNKI